MSRRIDLNCDMGEGFGAWRMGDDAGVMPWITSANIACGFHAGDSSTMAATVALARAHDVAVGAHVGLPDLAGFGRREMSIDASQAHAWTLHQLGAISAFTGVAGTRLRHVKPHGALYHMVARDPGLATAMVQAVRAFDASLRVFGPADSALALACARSGLAFAAEAFADRRYGADGRLVPRSEPNAVIGSADEAVAQALELIAPASTAQVAHVDTLCLHGDRDDAAMFAKALRDALETAGVDVAAPDRPAR